MVKRLVNNRSFLFVVLCPNILVLFYLFCMARPFYRSDAVFFVEKPTAAYGMSSDSIMLAREKNAGNYLFRNFSQSYGEFARLNARFHLADAYSSRVDVIRGFGGVFSLFQTNDDALFRYYKREILTISLDKKSGLLRMSVHAPSAALARDVAQAIMGDAHERITHLNREEEETFSNTAEQGIEDLLRRRSAAESRLSRTIRDTGIYSGWLYYEGLMNEQTNLDTRSSPIRGKYRSLLRTSPMESANQLDTVSAYERELDRRFAYLAAHRDSVVQNDTALRDVENLSSELAKLEVRKNAYALQNIMGRYYIKVVDSPSVPVVAVTPASCVWAGIVFLSSLLVYFMFC